MMIMLIMVQLFIKLGMIIKKEIIILGHHHQPAQSSLHYHNLETKATVVVAAPPAGKLRGGRGGWERLFLKIRLFVIIIQMINYYVINRSLITKLVFTFHSYCNGKNMQKMTLTTLYLLFMAGCAQGFHEPQFCQPCFFSPTFKSKVATEM